MGKQIGLSRIHGLVAGGLLTACVVWSCGGGAGTGGSSGPSGPEDGGGASGSTGGGADTTASSSTSSSSGTAAGSGSSSGGNGTSSTGATTGSGTSRGGSGSSSSSSSGAESSGGAAFSADRVVITGVRCTMSCTMTPAQTVINLRNAGTSAVQVTDLALSGADASQFQVTTATPVMIASGADLAVTVQMTTSGAGLPAPTPAGADGHYDSGSNLETATLTATLTSGIAQASVYGLLLEAYNYEPTLGQILTTLGYKLDVGQAQNDWNPNTSMMATTLPGIEAGTDEVAAPLFVKAGGAGSVTLNVVARFSPVGILPYGWYPSTSPTTMNQVGTMSMVTDAQTSNNARMVYPPLAAGGATTFDPGTATFGLWIYSDQKSETWNEGGNPVNGNYDYTQDALNTPANVHRIKTYPLKNATGTVIPQSYLIAVEEAANGDYQDYVLVISNVTLAP